MFIKTSITKVDKVFKSYKDFNTFVKIAGKGQNGENRLLKKLAAIPVIEADPDKFLFIRNRSISAHETWGPNQNFDAFPSKELQEKFNTFENCRISIDHKYEDDNDTIGIVIDSTYVPKQIYNERTAELTPFSEEKLNQLTKEGQIVRITGDYIENLLAIDKERANDKRPGLVQAIVNGEVSDTSMGCSVEKSECSVCHNVAEQENQFCEHIAYGKGRKFKVGKKEVIAYEINHGINFFEDSIILSEEFAKKSGHRAEAGGEGADARAKIVEVIAGEKKVAKKTGSILDYVKAAETEIPAAHLMQNNSVVIGEPDKEVEDMKQEIRDDLQDEIEKKKSILKQSATQKDFIDKAKHLDSEFNLKRFWVNANKSDKNDVLGLVKIFIKDGLEEDEIMKKLEGIGYSTELIKEALQYENLTNMDNKIASQLKDFLVEGYRLFEKLSGGFQREDTGGEDMNPVAPELDRRKEYVENFNSGVQEPASEISNGKDNPIWEKYQQIKKRLAQIDMEEDVIEKETEDKMTKEGPGCKTSKQKNYWNEEHVELGEPMLNGIGIEDEDGFYGKEPIEMGKDSGEPSDYKDMKNKDKEHSTSDWGYVRSKIAAIQQYLSPKDEEASVSTKDPDGKGQIGKYPSKSDESEMLADYPVAGSANEKVSYLKRKLNKVNPSADELQDSYKENKENYRFENAEELPVDKTKGNKEDYLDKEYIETHSDIVTRKKSSLKKVSKTPPGWRSWVEHRIEEGMDEEIAYATAWDRYNKGQKPRKKAAIDNDGFEEYDPDYREPGSEFTDEDFNFAPAYDEEFTPDDLFDIDNPPALHLMSEEELEKAQDWLSEKLFSPNLSGEEDRKITQLLDRIANEMGKYYPSQDWDYEGLEGLAKKKIKRWEDSNDIKMLQQRADELSEVTGYGWDDAEDKDLFNEQVAELERIEQKIKKLKEKKKKIAVEGPMTPTNLQPGETAKIYKKDDAGNPTSELVKEGPIQNVEQQESPEGQGKENTNINVGGENYSSDDFIVEKSAKSQLLEQLADLDVDDKMDKLSSLKSISIDEFTVEDFEEEKNGDWGDFGDLFENKENPEPQTIAKKSSKERPGFIANRYSSIKKESKEEDMDFDTMFDD